MQQSTPPNRSTALTILIGVAMFGALAGLVALGVSTFAQGVEVTIGQQVTPIVRTQATPQPTVTLAPATVTPRPPSDAYTTIESSAEQLALVNAARCEMGLTPLALDALLAEAALTHAVDMGLNAFFDHTGSDGSSVVGRVNATGYGWFAVGENIAAGPADAAVVHGLWMDSPGHRANILKPEFREMGIAHIEVEGTEYRHYWVQVFGTPAGEESTPPPCE